MSYDIDYGTKGKWDTLSGLHPCKIVGAKPLETLVIEITENSGVYRKGEQVEVHFLSFVLKKEIYKVNYSYFLKRIYKTVNPEIIEICKQGVESCQD